MRIPKGPFFSSVQLGTYSSPIACGGCLSALGCGSSPRRWGVLTPVYFLQGSSDNALFDRTQEILTDGLETLLIHIKRIVKVLITLAIVTQFGRIICIWVPSVPYFEVVHLLLFGWVIYLLTSKG
jgi:hypothetical protein